MEVSEEESQVWVVSSKSTWRSGMKIKKKKRDPRDSGEASTISTRVVKWADNGQKVTKVECIKGQKKL